MASAHADSPFGAIRACHIKILTFASIYTRKSGLILYYAGYNYMNRFIVGIMLFDARTLLRGGLLFGGLCLLTTSMATTLTFGTLTATMVTSTTTT